MITNVRKRGKRNNTKVIWLRKKYHCGGFGNLDALDVCYAWVLICGGGLLGHCDEANVPVQAVQHALRGRGSLRVVPDDASHPLQLSTGRVQEFKRGA